MDKLEWVKYMVHGRPLHHARTIGHIPKKPKYIKYLLKIPLLPTAAVYLFNKIRT